MFNKIKDIEYGVKISLEDEGLTPDQCVKIACLSHFQVIIYERKKTQVSTTGAIGKNTVLWFEIFQIIVTLA